MDRKKRTQLILMAVVAFAVLLIVDQLYLFGIPFGPILPDLSAYDITQNPDIHHWMLGLVLAVSTFFYIRSHKKEVI